MTHSITPKIPHFEHQHLIVCAPSIDPAAAREARKRRLEEVLAPLTGPHQVGYASKVIAGDSSKGDRMIGIEIYAPKSEGGERVVMSIPPQEDFAKLLSPEQLRSLYTHSTAGVGPQQRRPILIFSNGLGVHPVFYRPLLEQVASNGFIVLNLNHPSSSFWDPLSQQRLDSGDLANLNPTQFEAEIERMGSAQAANMHCVVAQIRDGSLGFARDSQILLAGHSLGGAASIEAARDNPEVAGCVNLDGGLIGKKSASVNKPLLLVVQDLKRRLETPLDARDRAQTTRVFGEWRDLQRLNGPHFHGGKVGGIEHMSFSAFPILDWLIGIESLASASKAHRVALREIIAFQSLL